MAFFGLYITSIIHFQLLEYKDIHCTKKNNSDNNKINDIHSLEPVYLHAIEYMVKYAPTKDH